MKIFLFSIFTIIFCFINYKIIISDQKTKKIPNKNLLELLILLPFWWIFLYFFLINEINIFLFLVQIFVSFLVSFLLFNFGIWKAGDAKYLLVLSLFIPHIGIIPFIGNLGIFTLFYLFLYFLWFFFGRSIFYRGYAKNLLQSIKTDLSEKWRIHKKNKGGKSFGIILKWLVVFLVIFVSIRLLRIYVFLEIFKNFGLNGNLVNFIQKYHFYMIFAGVGLTIAVFYFGKKFINSFKNFLASKFKINLALAGNIFLGLLFIFLIGFIGFEYNKNPDEIMNYLIKIFTIYILIYIFAKIIFYSYKLSFLGNEKILVPLKHLKQSDYLDIEEINKIFLFRNDKGEEGFKKLYDDAIFGNQFDIKKLKKLIRIQNKYDKKYNFSKDKAINSVICLKTFSFAIYIFLGFIITFIFQNTIITFLIEKVLKFFLQ